MKKSILFIFIAFTFNFYAQESDRFSSMDFVTVLNNNKAETRYYYNNNWKLLRKQAVKLGYIHSYQLLETTATEEAPFDFILITTYANKKQYANRESNFDDLISARSGLKLLNKLEPSEFRKILFSKDYVKHLD